MFGKRVKATAPVVTPAPAAAPVPPPAIGSASWFPAFGSKAPGRDKGAYFEGGDYLVEVAKFLRIVSENPKSIGHRLLVVEAKILHVFSSYPAVTNPDGTSYAASNMKGEIVSTTWNTTKNPRTLEDAERFLIACGKNEDPTIGHESFTPAEWQEFLMQYTEPPGASLAGQILRVVGSRTVTSTKQPFVRLAWYPGASLVANGNPGPAPDRQDYGGTGRVDDDIPF